MGKEVVRVYHYFHKKDPVAKLFQPIGLAWPVSEFDQDWLQRRIAETLRQFKAMRKPPLPALSSG